MKIFKLNGELLKEIDGADLRSADLRSADLRSANLRSADLRSANLRDAEIIGFSFGAHFEFYHEGYCKIGCIGMNIDEWLKSFEKVGEENGYTEHQIWCYGEMLKLLKNKEKILEK